MSRVATEPPGIVAGIGYRSRASGADIIGLVRQCMEAHGIKELSVLAAPGFKPARDQAPGEAAALLGLPLSMIDDPELARAAPRCLSIMRHVVPGAGDRSVAEACALAAAGDGAVLLGPRMLGALASCALARRAEPAK